MPSYVPEKYWKLREECFSDLGIDQERDESATKEIAELLESNGFDQNFPEYTNHEEAWIFGPAPYTMRNPFPEGLRIVADSGISRFLRVYGIPDIIVTDLDGSMEDILFCQKKGAFLFAHIHGDNLEQVRNAIPFIGKRTLFTCQTRETFGLFDFGGFTDGDRAAFVADHYGAETIKLYGFHFDNPVPKLNGNQARKLKKLHWAWKFIKELASDRGHETTAGEIISF